jgi:hypothetical protein
MRRASALRRAAAAIAAIALAACAQLPPSPEELRAKRFESAPGKAVIYLVRDAPDFSDRPATIVLDDAITLTVYPGTFYRWEAPAGMRRIAGFAGDAGSLRLQVEAGRVYFVRHSVLPWRRFPQSFFQPVDEGYGRAAVLRAELVGGR